MGDSKVGSSRIHGLNVHNELLKRGIYSKVIHSPKKRTDKLPFGFFMFYFLLIFYFNKKSVICIQKLHDEASINFVLRCKKFGIKTIFVDSDYPCKSEISKHIDKIICVSNYLKDQYIKLGFMNVYYIPDAPEAFDNSLNESFSYTIFWYGQSTEPIWNLLNEFKKYLISKRSKWKLITVSDHKESDHLWNKESLSLIKKFDVCFIPIIGITTPRTLSKSSNRLLQAMALSKPCIVYPIPAYVEILEQGKNGYLVNNFDEVIGALSLLENNKRRFDISTNSFKTALNFSVSNIVNDYWLKVLHSN